jgi:hypothetical protein
MSQTYVIAHEQRSTDVSDESEPTFKDTPEQVDPIRHAGRTIIITKTGERALLIGGTGRPGWVAASTEFSRHIMRHYAVEDVTLAPAREYGRKGYDLREDLTPIMTGLTAVPNFKPHEGDPLDFLNGLTLGGQWTAPNAGYAKVYHEGQEHSGWAKYFLRTTQGGQFDGTGDVIIYASPRWSKDAAGKQIKSGGAIIGHFAICKHEKVEHAGANHRRGWHPGHCSKCGLDLTVDSGD